MHGMIKKGEQAPLNLTKKPTVLQSSIWHHRPGAAKCQRAEWGIVPVIKDNNLFVFHGNLPVLIS
jgi:hypothetical protein